MSQPVDFQGATPSGIPRSLAVGVAVAVLVVGAALWKPWGDAPQASPAPSALTPDASPGDALRPAPFQSQTPTADSSPVEVDAFTLPDAASSEAEWTGIHWTPIDAAAPQANLAAVTPWSGGWVATASAPGASAVTLWRSADAVHWVRIAQGGATSIASDARVVGVAPLASGLLAVARAPAICRPAPCGLGDVGQGPLSGWISSDGRVWRPAPYTPFDAVGDTSQADVQVAGNASGVTIALTPIRDGPGRAPSTLLASADGIVWRELDPGTVPDGFSVASIAATPSTTVLVGSIEVDGGSVAAVAWSTDLWIWHVVRLPVAPGGPPGASAWVVQVGEAGLLALGSAADGAGTELWWRSGDGRTWSAVAGYRPLGPTSCDVAGSTCGSAADGWVLGDGRRLLALHWGSPPTAWTSSGDGQWRLIGVDSPGPVSLPSNVVLVPGGVIVTAMDGAWYGQATVAGGG